MNRPRALLSLLYNYARANTQGALEYRASLISQALGMLLNNVLWVVFWTAYFQRFELPGWTREDVIALWAVLAASVGLANVLFGNGMRLATLIERGELDFYLTLPKPLLLHALVSRMMLMSIGDLVFGPLSFGIYCHPGLQEWLLFGLAMLTGAAILVSFLVIAGSLAFWLGRAQSIASQLFGVLINFSTYPTAIFGERVRLLLYTLIPAALIGTLPVELIKSARPVLAAELLGAAVLLMALAGLIFHRGLRRYESGNLIAMRE